MSDASNYFENKIVNIMRGTTFTAFTAYAALFTAVSDAEAGSGTELSGNGYARQAVTFDAPSNGATQNSAAVTFGPNTGSNWGTVTHWALFDASSGGNAITAIKALASSRTVNVGDEAKFAIGELDFSVA